MNRKWLLAQQMGPMWTGAYWVQLRSAGDVQQVEGTLL
jgi:hypothetical protein